MKKILTFIILLVLLTPNVQSQKLIKVFDRYYAGDTAWAHRKFNKFINKKKEPYAAQYGLAMCIMPWQHKQAFIEFKKLDAKFRNSGKDFKNYMLNNYGITQDSVQFKMDDIASFELRLTILNDSTERGFNRFIKTYQGCNPDFIERAKTYREQSAYRAAIHDPSLKKAEQFLKDYPYSHKKYFVEDYIDSIHYFSHLFNQRPIMLKRFLRLYEKGTKYTNQAENLLADCFHDESYNDPFNEFVFKQEYFEKWRKEVYYSGHWNRLRFFAVRVPWMMNDTLKRMYYAGIYGEFHDELDRGYTYDNDSIYDFFIQRSAPSLLAFRKMQDMYSHYLANRQYDSVEAVLRKYEPLFPNHKYEIGLIRRLVHTDVDRCRPERLPDVINVRPYYPMEKRKVKDRNGNQHIVETWKYGYRFLDGCNKFPVISPDGKTLYYTHFVFKPVKLINADICDSLGIREVTSRIDTVLIGATVYQSRLVNNRWQNPEKVNGLNYLDSIWLERVTDTLYFAEDGGRRSDSLFVQINKKYYLGIRIHDVVRHKTGVVPVLLSGISNDNTQMLTIVANKLQRRYYDEDNRNNKQNGTMYYVWGWTVCASQNRAGTWTPPRMIIDINRYFELNEDKRPNPHMNNYNAHFSPDGKAIFIVSARRDVPAFNEGFIIKSYQDKYAYPFFFSKAPRCPNKVLQESTPQFTDIYVSKQNENGMWSYPVNIGNMVNTEYCEFSPVLAADNKTLYFISEAHYGMGGTDIFMTQRTDSTWTHWTPPVNLGRYINTPYNEYDFSITADGKTAYYTSEEPITHRQIFYKVELPPAFRPDTIAIYTGKVTDLQGNPLDAQIAVYDIVHNSQYAKYRTMEDGSFYFGLPQDSAAYQFTINARNMLSSADFMDAKRGKPIIRTRNFVLFSEDDIFEARLVAPFSEIELQNNDPILYGNPDNEIKRIAALFRKHNCDTIEIIATAPQKHIAQQRAESVAELFKQNGVRVVLTAIKTGKDKIEFQRK